MKSAIYVGQGRFEIGPGDRLRPGPGEVTLEVGYVGLCGTDLHVYHGNMDHRVCPPGVIGHEMSGVITDLGDNVDGFAKGDQVVVRPLDYCGDCPACHAGHSHVCHKLKFMGIDSSGALQSFWTVKARTLHKLPASIDLRRGALVEPLAVACHDVARARVQAGERVVVLGGGPIGQLIALVAKARGAEVLISEPTAVRRQYAADAGFAAFDPTTGDLAAHVTEWTEGKGADVVFEVAGVQATVTAMTDIAATRGRICMVAIHSSKPQVDLFRFFWRELELVGARVYEAVDFDAAIELIASGAVDVDALITSVRPIDEIQKAFEAMDSADPGMKTLLECSH
ncbi:zinc-binding dehydrogenase [Caulobacter sp. X]|uniref:zinc-dependent alcohol dehydrogenase n=1 Tax=Caulobacter sp. X TaxID=2048901 RepID=UPI000C14CFBA|nr:alcohol dehydrogenase catalytic domain-containing protein [Caulobacter sp. X]PIB95240.1 Zn-dependent alcohol dehydrogenase [Caulobacter sp. X]